MQRRAYLAAGGTVAATVFGLHTATQPAQGAEISMGELTVPDSSKLVTNNVTDARIAVDVSYEYNSNRAPDMCKLSLLLGTHPEEMYAVALQEHTDNLEANASGETTLEGSILNGPDFETMHLNPDPGGKSTVNMYVGVRLDVIANDKIQSQAYAEDFAALEIENGSYSITSDIGGTGSFEVVTEN